MWNATTAACQYNCSSFSYSTNATDADGNCICIPPYLLNKNIPGCVLLDCSVIEHVNPAASPVVNACVCLLPYSWQANGFFCFLNCSIVPNSDNTSTVDGQSCNCVPPYTWNEFRLTCGTYPANCSLVPYVNITASAGLTNGTCFCQLYYYWNETTQTCFKNCSLFPNTDNQSLPNGPCKCADDMRISMVDGDCLINCSLMENTDNDSSFGLNCTCKSGYTWNGPPNLACAAHCSNVTDPYISSNTYNYDGRCDCVFGFNYNATAMRC